MPKQKAYIVLHQEGGCASVQLVTLDPEAARRKVADFIKLAGRKPKPGEEHDPLDVLEIDGVNYLIRDSYHEVVAWIDSADLSQNQSAEAAMTDALRLLIDIGDVADRDDERFQEAGEGCQAISALKVALGQTDEAEAEPSEPQIERIVTFKVAASIKVAPGTPDDQIMEQAIAKILDQPSEYICTDNLDEICDENFTPLNEEGRETENSVREKAVQPAMSLALRLLIDIGNVGCTGEDERFNAGGDGDKAISLLQKALGQ
jgi:hypothetical protein